MTSLSITLSRFAKSGPATSQRLGVYSGHVGRRWLATPSLSESYLRRQDPVTGILPRPTIASFNIIPSRLTTIPGSRTTLPRTLHTSSLTLAPLSTQPLRSSKMVSTTTTASSATQDLIISVDIGTTSTRAIAFNKLAEVISTVQVEYDQSEYDRVDVRSWIDRLIPSNTRLVRPPCLVSLHVRSRSLPSPGMA